MSSSDTSGDADDDTISQRVGALTCDYEEYEDMLLELVGDLVQSSRKGQHQEQSPKSAAKKHIGDVKKYWLKKRKELRKDARAVGIEVADLENGKNHLADEVTTLKEAAASLKTTISAQQKSIAVLESQVQAKQEGLTDVEGKCSAKAEQVKTLMEALKKRNAEIRKLQGVKAQSLDSLVQGMEDADLWKLLQEQSHATDAAREDAAELLEDLRIKQREVQMLKQQLGTQEGGHQSLEACEAEVAPALTQHPRVLQYAETQFELTRKPAESDGQHPLTQCDLRRMPKATTSEQCQEDRVQEGIVQPSSSTTRMLNNLNELLDIKNNLIECLEGGWQNTSFIIACKNYIIVKWERALGTCFAELEQIQESGRVETRIIQLDTSLIFEDEDFPFATTIRTVLYDPEELRRRVHLEAAMGLSDDDNVSCVTADTHLTESFSEPSNTEQAEELACFSAKNLVVTEEGLVDERTSPAGGYLTYFTAWHACSTGLD